MRAAVERYGGIDVFLNNAGFEGAVKPITEYPIEVFDRVIAVNVRGAWLGLRSVIPEMAKRGGGSIMITSSVAGIHGAAGVSAYVISKHAVIGMMRTAALECAPLKIRVNTVNPAPIETRMMRSLEDGFAPGQAAEAKQQILARIPMAGYGTAEEVAETSCSSSPAREPLLHGRRLHDRRRHLGRVSGRVTSLPSVAPVSLDHAAYRTSPYPIRALAVR